MLSGISRNVLTVCSPEMASVCLGTGQIIDKNRLIDAVNITNKQICLSSFFSKCTKPVEHTTIVCI